MRNSNTPSEIYPYLSSGIYIYIFRKKRDKSSKSEIIVKATESEAQGSGHT